MALPSNSLATDLQKGQFFPTRGQAGKARATADMGSTADITDDAHAQEEHAKAIANTAEVCDPHAAAISATMHIDRQDHPGAPLLSASCHSRGTCLLCCFDVRCGGQV